MKDLLKHIFLLVMFQMAIHTGAQEIALDFTRADCKGVEHHLFSELDSGKVIILDFVMLGCAPCIWATRDLDTIVSGYSSTHPGRVKIYAFSYENTHTCDQMFEWRAAGGFTDVTLFTMGAGMVSYYGGMGMPSIVVTGTSMHKVFYNGYGYSQADDPLIVAAIENALNYDQSGENEILYQTGFKVYPTLFTDRINIEISQNIQDGEILILDLYGRIIKTFPASGNMRHNIPVSDLSGGIYFVRLSSGCGISGCYKLIKR